MQILEVQWNLSKADTYGTEVFLRFRVVSALERFELKSSQIKVWLFYTGPIITWTFVMQQFILHQRLK